MMSDTNFFTRHLSQQWARKKFNVRQRKRRLYKCRLSELDAHRSASRYLGTRIYADAPKSETNCVGKHGHCSQGKNRRSVFTSRRPFWKVIYTVLSLARRGGTRARPSTKDLVPPLHPFRSLAQALVLQYSQGRRGTICHGHRDSRSDDRA